MMIYRGALLVGIGIASTAGCSCRKIEEPKPPAETTSSAVDAEPAPQSAESPEDALDQSGAESAKTSSDDPTIDADRATDAEAASNEFPTSTSESASGDDVDTGAAGAPQSSAAQPANGSDGGISSSPEGAGNSADAATTLNQKSAKATAADAIEAAKAAAATSDHAGAFNAALTGWRAVRPFSATDPQCRQLEQQLMDLMKVHGEQTIGSDVTDKPLEIR
jgi:hypothetical protein